MSALLTANIKAYAIDWPIYLCEPENVASEEYERSRPEIILVYCVSSLSINQIGMKIGSERLGMRNTYSVKGSKNVYKWLFDFFG